MPISRYIGLGCLGLLAACASNNSPGNWGNGLLFASISAPTYSTSRPAYAPRDNSVGYAFYRRQFNALAAEVSRGQAGEVWQSFSHVMHVKDADGFFQQVRLQYQELFVLRYKPSSETYRTRFSRLTEIAKPFKR